ncbi:28S ribosomal protein S17, mitochondrial [Acyrthosiphon pisum]|uniref:ACYPI008968 protein n=1 Tax=Acyrthosiphon pisum TaxID=7029 RepID=C4WWC7_ACYPI|nr:28S ribosomal protein S17, mitochondrial-like [Acyrthosiphon pisum]XP_016659609.1 28S ribosomal protein S17, mitochondrial [Acyrthosiphon pisum]BAH72197.1 ACYPI008968 [Acyrthosiphon pisum]|eukprot:NP_001162111.1 28S ribosomal protein S17, mitochondrial-like [Acyrthosiphon pisum]
MSLAGATKSLLLLGRCAPSVKQNASKIIVKKLELDQNLLMYFHKDEVYYAHDPEQQCKTGDVVLIQELSEKLTTHITHQVLKVVYPLGDVTDPITNKKVAALRSGTVCYRDDLEEIDNLYGLTKKRFNYANAPKRGWQEDKKDFSHKKSYIKYHESEEEQPYSVPR